MPLITPTNSLAFADYLGGSYLKVLSTIDTVANQASPAAGTVQNLMNGLQNLVIATVDDPDQVNDLFAAVHGVFLKTNAEYYSDHFRAAVAALSSHAALHGASVSSTINSLSSYLQWYNSASGNGKFSALIDPNFAALYLAIFGVSLPQVGVMSPAIHPTWNAANSANGMGKVTYAAAFSAGTAVNNTLYSEVQPVVEVTTTFVGGSSPPVVTIAGIDDAAPTPRPGVPRSPATTRPPRSPPRSRQPSPPRLGRPSPWRRLPASCRVRSSRSTAACPIRKSSSSRPSAARTSPPSSRLAHSARPRSPATRATSPRPAPPVNGAAPSAA